METTSFKPYFIVVGLMVATSLLLAFTVDIRITDEAGIKMLLPEQVGKWHGEDVLYCHNASCQKEFRGQEIKGSNVCPACGGELSSISKAERDVLPPDTGLVRKQYVSSDGRVVFVSIVLSGKERSSIHRPQMCLIGQGHEIVRSITVPVPLDGRKPLDVMALELLRRYKTAEGKLQEYTSYYAYWFVGKGRETPSHVQRMVWMATDRIFHNVSHRWAYISVSGIRRNDVDDYQKEMVSFIHDLYPEIRMN